MAPRKHTNIEAPDVSASKVEELAPIPVVNEAALGVLTPALSDLAVLTRVDAILESDLRSPEEVRSRWAHLDPIVEAFRSRLGSLDLESGALTIDELRPERDDAARDEVPPPPDPGELSFSPKG